MTSIATTSSISSSFVIRVVVQLILVIFPYVMERIDKGTNSSSGHQLNVMVTQGQQTNDDKVMEIWTTK